MNDSRKSETVFDLSKLDVKTTYQLLTSTIVPRPIAWVTSLNPAGKTNLAPFSYFNLISSNPPALMISVSRKGNGTKKDTLLNIEDRKEFVVHLTDEPFATAINETSSDLPREESEVEKLGLEQIPSIFVKTPTLKISKLSLECSLEKFVEIGDGTAGSTTLVIGRIQILRALTDILDETQTSVVYEKLSPLARLGGPNWLKQGKVFPLIRPK